MAVSVIVCTRNRAKRLAHTLESLANMRVGDDVDWEVVVVDNASTDDTAAVVDGFLGRLPLRRVVEARMGHAHARNRGTEVARGETLVWIDDDVDLPAGWLDAWIRGFRAFPGAAFFGSDIEVRFEVDPPHWVMDAWDQLAGLFAERRIPGPGATISIDYLPFGANFAVRASVQRANPFDPAFGRVGDGLAGGDETTVLTRLLESGREGRWIEGAGLTHVMGPERVELPRLRRQLRAGTRLLEPEPRVRPGGPVTSTAEIRRQWLRAELRWRLGRWISPPKRWVRDFIAAASWLGHLDRRLGRTPP